MTMDRGIPRLISVATVLLVVLSSQGAAQVQASVAKAQPTWVTINASAQGNYPGGDEVFTVFVVNSAHTPVENETIDSMNVTAPFGSNTATDLPQTLAPGESLFETIHLSIPTNFTQKSFQATLLVQGRIWNGTGYNRMNATGSVGVALFTLIVPPPTQGGNVPTTLLAAAVAIPSFVAAVLLVLLVRARSASRRTGT
jgi:hypothetical protein